MLLAQTQRSVPPEMSSLLSSHLVYRGFYPLRYYKRVSKGITLQYMIVVMGHSGDFGNAAKMVGKMPKSVMQLISIGF